MWTPLRMPEWIIKACWNATAHYLRIAAKDEQTAVDKAWRQIARREGGAACLSVTVIRKTA